MDLLVRRLVTIPIQYGSTDSECSDKTPPVPPNLSLRQPKYTARMRYCFKAEAHITHGSTVTYRSVDCSTERGYVWSASAIAKNSA